MLAFPKQCGEKEVEVSVTTADLHAQHNSQLWSVKSGMNLHSNLMGILSIESE